MLRIPQAARFVIAGGVVAVVNILGGLGFHAAGLPIQAAILVAYLVAMCVHFTLQRFFVFANHDTFVLALRPQIARYLVASGAQYLLIAALTAVVPPLTGIDDRVAYVGVVVFAAVANFLVLRMSVFHGRSAS